MSNKVLIPSDGPDDWKRFLAQPDLQWATGYSARTLANAWEAAHGLPPEIATLTEAAFGKGELLFAIPEHKTALPGGRRESQSDVFLLVRHEAVLATYTIEEKVDEPFGPTVGEWLVGASQGKNERLRYLCDLLGLSEVPSDVHYQLLHRTASALIEAERFDAKLAGMIVHSFSPENRWREAFDRFAEILGLTPEEGEPITLSVPSNKKLMLGWASGPQEFRSA
ncbi:hypothetical protein GRI38_13840 [Altererythrobacter aurantiacus]|uniref:DUF6946 domain-containing protein n=1 Tax=Parapontixanthobacter aurantiacus TaxID=1463599 RepID=A0A844ZJC1_9SPHN|nr:hypothetical protein [Parapontixanthobacter aurantiacus]MXO87110.1 hypothetical protein [Parapontixanthobacter aurantiacus]